MSEKSGLYKRIVLMKKRVSRDKMKGDETHANDAPVLDILLDL